jgi:HD-GYP domain-containing protein (c-di-GMP phosphodiesterase class II)
MAKRRISAADMVVGLPLPWNAYNAAGRLLLHKGEIVADQVQIDRMAAQGLFSEESDAEGGNVGNAHEKPSVVRMIDHANDLLQRILPSIANMPLLADEIDADKKLRAISRLVYGAVVLNANVSIACIQLNQDAAPYVYRHAVDTAIVSAAIAHEMRLKEAEMMTIIAAALTANIGMLDFQEKLQKRAKLTEEEKQRMQQHPLDGVEILRNVGIEDEEWLSLVLHHHESEDGSGYPNSSKGEDIPLGAKIIGIADRYCARVSNKAYRDEVLPNAALRDILVQHASEISLPLAAHFVKIIGRYPPGATVRLKNQEIGVVIKNGTKPTTPVVRVTIGKTGLPVEDTLLRDTENPMYAIKEEVPRNMAGASLVMSKFWGDVAAL